MLELNSFNKPHMTDKSYKTHTIDAADQPLGRLASRVAGLLVGKGKRTYAPNVDQGDEVIVRNISKVRLTGQKLAKKEYIRVTGYPGGLRRIPASKLLKEHPERALRVAVLRMLPKNRLQKGRIKRLKFE